MRIELKNLVKTYASLGKTAPVTAVNGVSLEIPSNGIYGIIGKSGAGKSSLVRLVSMLERPDSGQIFYGGERVDCLSERELRERRRRELPGCACHHEPRIVVQRAVEMPWRCCGHDAALG